MADLVFLNLCLFCLNVCVTLTLTPIDVSTGPYSVLILVSVCFQFSPKCRLGGI